MQQMGTTMSIIQPVLIRALMDMHTAAAACVCDSKPVTRHYAISSCECACMMPCMKGSASHLRFCNQSCKTVGCLHKSSLPNSDG